MAQTKMRLMSLALNLVLIPSHPIDLPRSPAPEHKIHTTEAYLNLCRRNNTNFYQVQDFKLNDIVLKYGPWVQKLNEDTNGAYVHKSFCFVLTLSDAEDGISGYSRKPGVMFGTTAYQDYYPSGEIVIECLRYRFRGYHTVRVEFLFELPYSIAGSVEEFLIQNLDVDNYECLNYNIYSPHIIDFKSVFKVHNESFETYGAVFKSFFSNSSRSKPKIRGLVLEYLPSNLESNFMSLIEYYQDEFSLRYIEEPPVNYHFASSYHGSNFLNFATKSPLEKAIWTNLTSKPVLTYNGGVERTNQELVVKSYLLKTNIILERSWSEIPDELSNKLFLHPYYLHGGLVYSLSDDVIQGLRSIEQNRVEYNEKVNVFDSKLQRLFMMFGKEESNEPLS
ncbi:uncharacterized protein CANTADRAFT_207429 [Suhomyces tanzawaensis NRRL Y-17324]|uniref:Uncharacterized protein n=1 Tax=Suhomyces tanzawaensis NRRL Y-17324 TaxID=984487 RepID=A0A1E4SJF9_9ASCO|nr:uncharacterized protein CANTADRAFT_207429 [Suhomyces tanzawaensis NRRL Y-17324]ODV79641.1 hypothetical protein CANTADRAFT_207429 [Suhomyces tanzawaensis NRRL Y-17324]